MKSSIYNYILLFFKNDLNWKKGITYTRIAEALSIVAFVIVFFPSLKEDINVLMAVVFMGIFGGFMILDNLLLKGKIYFLFQEFEPLRKKAALADSLNLLNKGFSDIHRNERDDVIESKMLLNSLENICTKVALVLNKYTTNDCSVCIKIFSEPISKKDTSKLSVVTLCRDTLGTNRALKADINCTHLVKNNTDFITIFENIGKTTGRYFLCNNLPLRKDYKNTSFEYHSDNYTYMGLPEDMEDSERDKHWPLPYKSTLVLPIDDNKDVNEETFIGYICVDSLSINTFDNDLCVKLLSGINDGIYNTLYKLVKTLQNGKTS